MNRNIYLVGFMGSGKSAVGRVLAECLNRGFVDMDLVLESELGRPIREVFARDGEEFFREREAALLKKLSRRPRLIVATGGGVVERDLNRELMRASGRIVHLESSLEACRDRLGPGEISGRPLWQDPDFVRRLFERRKGMYADCDLGLSADGSEPAEIAGAVTAGLFPEQRFTMRLGRAECPVIGTFDAPAALARLIKGRRAALLTDRNVAKAHADRFSRVVDFSPSLVLAPGERTKSLKSAQRVYETLLENHFHRDDLLVALGGGVVTDLGAYAASTYKRGLPFVLMATSLVGCVDAALGGKAAVNLGAAKNAVGCFTVPEAVILDFSALGTLKRAAISEGLVEAYKTGLVAAPELAGLIEQDPAPLLAKDLPGLARVAALSARAKGEVVARDFRDQGWRGILNFGHTFGHAVEGWHGFRVSHGLGVAMGMIAAAGLSRDRGLITGEFYERIVETLRRIMPRRAAWPPAGEAWEIIQHDKKIRKGKVVFILLEGPGRPVMADDVSRAELAGVLAGLEA